MELNRISLGNFMNNDVPDHWADVIIADPPYYKVKGEFDKVWDSFDAYLKDVEKWAAECARILSYNGTLVWYGSDQNLAYQQIILDRFFHFLNNCVIYKTNGIQVCKADPAAQRSFFSNDERFLLYENNSSDTADESGSLLAKNAYSFQLGMLHSRCVAPVIDYLKAEKERAGVTNKAIDDCLGNHMAGHYFNATSQFVFPTREAYEKMRELFNQGRPGSLVKDYDILRREYDDLRTEYEERRKEYEDLRRPFTMQGRQTDVFVATVDCGASKRFGHPTSKDLKITYKILKTISRPGSKVFVPFGGSGTECVAAKLLGLDFVSYELNETYQKNANERITKTTKK